MTNVASPDAPPDNGRHVTRVLGGIDRAVAVLVRGMDLLLFLVMLALVIVGTFAIVARYFFGSSLPWANELSGYFFVALTFLGTAVNMWRGSLPRVTILERKLGPFGNCVLSGATFSLIALLLYQLLISGLALVQVTGNVNLITLPISQSIPHWVIPITAMAMLIVAVRNFVIHKPGLGELLGISIGVACVAGVSYANLSALAVYLLLFVGLIVLLLAGIPIGFAIGVVALFVVMSEGLPLTVVPQQIFEGTGSVVLLAIPFFMLAGGLMSASGMADGLIDFISGLFGRVTGGLGIANVGASAVFADVSASAVAGTAAIGNVMIPQMVKRGYSREFAAGLQASTGTLGLMFPPGSTMIVYAVVAGTSVVSVFAHSFVPGVLVALSFVLLTYLIAKKRKIPKSGAVSAKVLGQSFVRAIPGLLTPGIIIVGILGGITTVMEAGVAASLFCLLIGLALYRTINVRSLYSLFLDAAVTASQVTLIIATGSLLAWIVTAYDGPQAISEWLINLSDSPIVILLLICALLLVLHTFLEGVATTLMIVPIILPALTELGVSPAVFGVILAQNAALGLLTPPVGFNLFVAGAISGVRMEQVARAALPYMAVLGLDIVVLVVFPQIAEVLPALLGL